MLHVYHKSDNISRDLIVFKNQMRFKIDILLLCRKILYDQNIPEVGVNELQNLKTKHA